MRTQSKRYWAWGIGLLSLGFLGGCGSRTQLREGVVIPECERDSECVSDNACERLRCIEGSCQVSAVVTCEASNSCHESTCDPENGGCVVRRLTEDLDGDGFFAPLPGFLPGAPGACGDDCDDTRASAHPGGVEICDGVDNDCDGIIDNESLYLTEEALPGLPAVVPVAAASHAASGGRGIAYGAGQFAVSYWGRSGETHSYLRGLRARGEPTFSERRLVGLNAPSFGAQLAWSGQAFGAIWSDARVDDNYEIYFALFNGQGDKLGADLRVTQAPGFSIHPDMLFDQGQFIVAFDDRREEEQGGAARIFGQRISAQGALLGANVALSPVGVLAEYPKLTATARRLGLVYTALRGERLALEFRSFDKSLQNSSQLRVIVSEEVQSPSITALGDFFLVTWENYGTRPGAAIQAVLLSEDGEILVGPSAITSGATFARSHSLLSLGDRALLVWSDDRDGNFELYAKVIGADLLDIEPRRRLTHDPAYSLSPTLAWSDQGTIGVLFDDWRAGSHGAYFLSLGCAEPPLD